MGNLGSVIDELLAADMDAVPDAGLMDEVVELRRQINRLEAAYLDRLVRVDRTGAASTARGSTQAWLREETRVSPGRSHLDVHLARELTDVLPATRAALRDG